MDHRTRHWRLLMVGMLAVLLAAPLLQAEAASDVNGEGKFWPFHHTPVRVDFGDNLSNQWERYFRNALDQWNQSDVVQGNSVRGATSGAKCDAKNGTVQVCDGNYGTNTGWLGLTTLNFKGDLITSATVQINDSFFSQPNTTAKTRSNTRCATNWAMRLASIMSPTRAA